MTEDNQPTGNQLTALALREQMEVSKLVYAFAQSSREELLARIQIIEQRLNIVHVVPAQERSPDATKP